MGALLYWLGAFAFTQAMEIPLYVRFGGLSFPQAFVPSLVTHPIVWFVFFHPALHLSWLQAVVLAELFAWLAEAALLHWVLWKKAPKGFRMALAVSLLANGISFGAGLISSQWFGFP